MHNADTDIIDVTVGRITQDWASVLSYDCAATKHGEKSMYAESSTDESRDGGREKMIYKDNI